MSSETITVTPGTEAVPANQQQKLVGQPPWMSIESYSLALLGSSTIAYSIMSAYIKLAASTGLSSNELVLARALFQGFFVVSAMMWYEDRKDDGSTTKLIWLPLGGKAVRMLVLARGFMGAMGFCFFYYTVSVLPLGDAVTLLSLSPIITVLAAAIVLSEPIRMSHLLAAASSLVGSMFISQPTFLFGRDEAVVAFHEQYPALGYVTALLGASCGASVYILMRRAGKVGVHTLQLLFSWASFSTMDSVGVGLIIPTLRGMENSFIWPPSTLSWYYVVGSCVFGTVGHFFLNYAGRHAPAGLVSIVRSSGIMWSYALEIVVFHQVPELLTIIGVCLIVISLAMVAIEMQEEEKQIESSGENGPLSSNGPERTVARTRKSKKHWLVKLYLLNLVVRGRGRWHGGKVLRC